jgi:hypothetical protein
MKLLATAIFAGMLAFGTAACAKEEPKKATTATAPAVPAVADVKKDEAPKTKKVCIKTTDPKTQKEVEKCRTVKIHEKHEGTKMSDAKKDPKKEVPKK